MKQKSTDNSQLAADEKETDKQSILAFPSCYPITLYLKSTAW